jgi:hypothetical protein
MRDESAEHCWNDNWQGRASKLAPVPLYLPQIVSTSILNFICLATMICFVIAIKLKAKENISKTAIVF